MLYPIHFSIPLPPTTLCEILFQGPIRVNSLTTICELFIHSLNSRIILTQRYRYFLSHNEMITPFLIIFINNTFQQNAVLNNTRNVQYVLTRPWKKMRVLPLLEVSIIY